MRLHSLIMLISGSVIAVPIGIAFLMLFCVCPICIFDARYINSTAWFGLLSGALGIAGGLVASRSVAGTLGIVGSLTSLHGFFGIFGIKFPRIFICSLPTFMEMYEAALALMLIGGILALLSLARDAVRKVKIDDSRSFFRLFLLYIIAITFLVIFLSQYGITDIRFLVCSWAAFLIFSIAILGLEKFVKYQKDKSRKE